MATVTNRARSVQSDTWAEATYAWEDAGSRTWRDQRAATNRSRAVAVTVTNKAKN